MQTESHPARIARVATLLLAVTALGGLLVAACHRPCARGRMNPEKIHKFVTWKIDDVLDDLEADETQRRQVHAVKERVFEEVAAMHAGRGEHKAQVRAELLSDAPDPELLHRLVDNKIDDVRAFVHKRLDDLLEVHAVLTPAQRQQLAEMLGEHAAQN